MAMQPVAIAQQDWTSGCCGCFEDPASCFIVCCLGTCVTHGQNVDTLKGSGFVGPCCVDCCLTGLGCPCFHAGPFRTELRAKYGLKEEPMSDMLMHFPCCHAFAVCQEARELKKRSTVQ